MKILTFADLHVGTSTYGGIDGETGLNTRVLNALASLDATIDYAIENEFKIIVAAGDMYRNAAPSRTMSDEFDKRIQRISDAGIKLLMLDGNHDVSKMPQTKSPMAHFSTLKVTNVTHTRFYRVEDVTIDGETVRFVFLPTYHTSEEIAHCVEITDTTTYPTVFIFHGTIQGAMLNEWNIADKETYVPLETFDKEGVSAVVMGHLHKPQILSRKPLIYYTGSLQRIDFSEEKQPKGFVVLNVEPDGSTEYEFVDIPSQEFLTLNFDLREGDDGTNIIVNRLDKLASSVKNSIVRIIVNLERANALNEARIIEYGKGLGAYYMLDIKKNYPKLQNVRIAGLTSELSEEEALKLYYKDKENSESKVARGIGLIEELKREGKL